MMKKKLLVYLIIFFSVPFFSLSIEPDIFVQSTVNRASKLLGEDISKNEKIEKLKLIAKETVDIKGIGFYTLGAKRKSLSDEEKKGGQGQNNNISTRQDQRHFRRNRSHLKDNSNNTIFIRPSD